MIFGGVATAVLIAALVPVGWLAPWTTRASELAYLPLVPLGDLAMMTRHAIEQPQRSQPSQAEVDLIIEERNDTRRRLFAATARIEELEARVQELSRLPFDESNPSRRLIHARIVARSADRIRGVVRLNAGVQRGVEAGAIAVDQGDALVGRVLESPGPTSAFLVPVATGGRLIDGVLAVADGAIVLQLEAKGHGFEASVDRRVSVQVGDIVRLLDSSWPRSAQGMRIAEVTAIRPRESNPNRTELLLAPISDAHRLSRVLLVVEEDTGDAP